MRAAGKTILLVEQNARAGLRLSTHGVVLENGRVRLEGSGREVLEHPEIGALYLGGAITVANGDGSGGSDGAAGARPSPLWGPAPAPTPRAPPPPLPRPGVPPPRSAAARPT